MDNATKASAFPTSCCAIGFGSRQNQSGKGWSEWLTFVSLLMSSVLARQLEIFSLDLWAKSNFPCSFLTDEAALKSLMISSRPSILRTPLPFGASLSRGFNLKSNGQLGAIFFVTLKSIPFSGNDRFTGLQAPDSFSAIPVVTCTKIIGLSCNHFLVANGKLLLPSHGRWMDQTWVLS